MTAPALLHAWQIARAHGHHWASEATPARLALARALPHWLWQAPWGREYDESLEELGLDDPDTLLPEEPDLAPPDPPANYEEAELLGRLPTCTGEGRTVPPLGEDGSLSDGTGSGRVRWTCHASGAVDVWIDRPAPGRRSDSFAGVAVVHVRVTGASVRVERLGAYWLRHAASLAYALRALGVPEREVRRAMLGAEDAGSLYERPAMAVGESRETYFARADAAREAWLSSAEPLPWIDPQAVAS